MPYFGRRTRGNVLKMMIMWCGLMLLVLICAMVEIDGV